MWVKRGEPGRYSPARRAERNPTSRAFNPSKTGTTGAVAALRRPEGPWIPEAAPAHEGQGDPYIARSYVCRDAWSIRNRESFGSVHRSMGHLLSGGWNGASRLDGCSDRLKRSETELLYPAARSSVAEANRVSLQPHRRQGLPCRGRRCIARKASRLEALMERFGVGLASSLPRRA